MCVCVYVCVSVSVCKYVCVCMYLCIALSFYSTHVVCIVCILYTLYTINIQYTQYTQYTNYTNYAGSQNFSKTSWGLGRSQPGNVEIGVVVVARSREEVEELRQRFPVRRREEAWGKVAAERGYMMARGPADGDT